MLVKVCAQWVLATHCNMHGNGYCGYQMGVSAFHSLKQAAWRRRQRLEQMVKDTYLLRMWPGVAWMAEIEIKAYDERGATAWRVQDFTGGKKRE